MSTELSAREEIRRTLASLFRTPQSRRSKERSGRKKREVEEFCEDDDEVSS